MRLYNRETDGEFVATLMAVAMLIVGDRRTLIVFIRLRLERNTIIRIRYKDKFH